MVISNKKIKVSLPALSDVQNSSWVNGTTCIMMQYLQILIRFIHITLPASSFTIWWKFKWIYPIAKALNIHIVYHQTQNSFRDSETSTQCANQDYWVPSRTSLRIIGNFYSNFLPLNTSLSSWELSLTCANLSYMWANGRYEIMASPGDRLR